MVCVYVCENNLCGFVFERSGPVDVCPDCGSIKIRVADNDETLIFNKNKLEIEKPRDP